MANPLKYVDASVTSAKPTYSANGSAPTYTKGTYNSKYGSQVSEALGNVTNFNYDPLKDASYQALAKIYTKRGEQAAKNTMGDAAALNGGLGTSYATSAAQQTRNDYNQELASLIPDLEEKAYSRAMDRYSVLSDAENTEYSRYRDDESDNQWQYSQDYTKYRDDVADNQWKYSQDYQAYRDAVADSQWAKNYNLDVYSLKKANSGGSGSGRKSSGGGSSSGSNFLQEVWNGSGNGKKNSTGKTVTLTVDSKNYARSKPSKTVKVNMGKYDSTVNKLGNLSGKSKSVKNASALKKYGLK